MTLSDFIEKNVDHIVTEWATFARTMLPAGKTMTDLQLRDHGQEILLAICEDMETRQSEAQRSTKAKGIDSVDEQAPGSAHGALRQIAGFDLVQLVAEFRAMRASVLALWRKAQGDNSAGARAIEEIARFNEGIDQALAESVVSYSAAVDASRDTFLAVLGHDLRAPLAVISMSNALLTRPGVSEKARSDALLRLGRATTAMSHLITDLIDFTRMQLGVGLPIERSACDFAAVCEEAVDAVRASYPSCEFEVALAAALPIQGDVPRLHQALANLLNNAVQHGKKGEPVVVCAKADGPHAVFTVKNSGHAIPPESLEAIFEPLVQGPITPGEAHERTKTSTGLGLFIVREIVRGHGGEVSVESSASAGTTFTLRIPRS